jgi:hypothetical protein
MTFVGEHLLRVEILPRHDGPVKLLAAELFEDGIVIRWARRSFPRLAPGEPEPAFGPTDGFRVGDDVGTRYEVVAGGVSAAGDGYQGMSAFIPAVPSTARWLVVHYRDDPAIRVAL